MSQFDRRTLIAAAAAATAVGATAAACTGGGDTTGSGVNQDAGSVNDMVIQQGEQTITAYNRVKRNPADQYPATALSTSLELENLRKKLLTFNEPSKLGWAYLFSQGGALLAVLPVAGKISSTQSAMTATTGVYSASGTGGGNVAVDLPGDDLSFGPNEGGAAGKFFYTPDGVYVFWDGPLLYLDTQMDVLATAQTLGYPKGAVPTPSKA